MDDNNTPSPSETALYIERMCTEMRNLAAGADLNFLAYLLDVTREEAAEQSGIVRVAASRGNVSAST